MTFHDCEKNGCPSLSEHITSPKTTAPDVWEEEYDQMWSAVEKQGFEVLFKEDIKYNKNLIKYFISSLLAQARADTVAEVLALGAPLRMKFQETNTGIANLVVASHNDALDQYSTAISRLVDRDETV